MADSDRWTVEVDPPILLPGRSVRVALTYNPDRDHEARGASAVLRCVERYRYSRTETRAGAKGTLTSHRVTRTDEEELARQEIALAGPSHFVRGQPESWQFEVEVPALGPATFEGDVLRCDWTLEAKVDLPMRMDEGIVHTVRVAQPTALLRAGVVKTGQYGLFEEAPANVDHFPAQIRLEPTPICLTQPFAGTFTVETPEPIEVQEVRLELRVKAEVTVSGGHEEEILVGLGHLDVEAGRFGGEFATHRFHADAHDAWLPSIDLPHGRARGAFHVILALAWAPDIHYVREVALATTDEL
ncbi:MAG TPA: hypothetical protein VEW45_04610 [Candidatus Dormibacteraeota bacterium]|nr:hypothetical protein [Candidatus Dormibacteraeota bacterium]